MSWAIPQLRKTKIVFFPDAYVIGQSHLNCQLTYKPNDCYARLSNKYELMGPLHNKQALLFILLIVCQATIWYTPDFHKSKAIFPPVESLFSTSGKRIFHWWKSTPL
ncbi:hypothetical protein HMPREF1555_00854 [Porphyromonas gingivalis F0570]|uniref:Uncharacterized protein n=1 Tax=Porphyromonas gingivalis F0570 TaxID=1227271 RepID=A0A0E2M697_PORGN|nr:hypothetical protein HMPREF1555_00854 [Porphyromonas gingivalis F0570]